MPETHKLYKKLSDGLKKVKKEIGPECRRKVKNVLDSIETHLGDLYEMVINDPKTGVYNSKFFDTITQLEIEKAKRGQHLALIITDIDNFKMINDKFGHKKGDVMLKSVVKMIKLNTRKSDVVGRFGGEEFTVLLPSTDYEKAFIVAERIRKAVFYNRYLRRYKLTISIGISEYRKGDTKQHLFNKADESLMYAKTHGKNRTVMHKDI